MIGEHDRVGPEQAEQRPEQEGRIDPRRPRHGRMREEREIGIVAHQPVKIGQARNHRGNHQRVDSELPGDGGLPPHAIEVAREARHVARRMAGRLLDRPQRRRNCLNARRKR